MKSLLLICAGMVILASKADSQSPIAEPAAYRLFVTNFIEEYNRREFRKIADSTSDLYKKSVPVSSMEDFLKEVYGITQKITGSRFKYFDKKGSAVYLFKGEKNWMYFIMTLNPRNKIDRFVVTDPNYNEELPVVMSKTRMRLPFDTTWYTFWGGDTEEQNYHVTSKAQRNAYDFVIRNEQNKSFKTNGKSNEDYYCFGKPIYAPCDGTVINSIDTVHDNNPGDMNPARLTGNSLLIQTRAKEYILLAHFKQYGVLVKTGQKIKKGQLIGYCGNSGNSSEPHLHMHVMDGPSLRQASGIKCTFEKMLVNGQLKKAYSPVRGERVANNGD